MPTIGQGGTITLTAIYTDGTGALVDPATPLVSIINPAGTTLVSNAVPVRASLGTYTYAYAVAAAAPLGTWTARWSGVINSVYRTADEAFTVVTAGSIGFDSYALVPWIAETKVDWTDVDSTIFSKTEAIAVATDFLWEACGRQYGARSTTERPHRCWPSCVCIWPWESSTEDWPYGDLACACRPTELELDYQPIRSVTSVKENGATLAAASYRIVNARTLIRVDGGSWPCCQRINVATAVLEVTYTWGRVVPPTGVRAAEVLAREFALGASPATANRCRLPKGAQALVRQGVSLTVRRAVRDMASGGIDTGIPEVEMFLAVKNPKGRRHWPRIASPETVRSARVR